MVEKHKRQQASNKQQPSFDKKAYLEAAEKVAKILQKEKLQKQHA